VEGSTLWKGGAEEVPVLLSRPTHVAVVFAVLLMYTLEQELVNEFKEAGLLTLYLRYIDDILACFTSRQAADLFWERFNQLNPCIQVTGPIAKPDEGVNYLDMTMHLGPRFLREGKLDIRLFQKPLNRYLYLPFESYHPRHARLSFIPSELKRYVLRNTEEWRFLQVRRLFYLRLRVRGYPDSVLRSLFKRVTYSLRASLLVTRVRDDNSGPTAVLVVPWSPTTEWMEISKLIHDTWPLAHCDITRHWRAPMVCFTRSPSIGTLIHGSAMKRPLTE
jgi:hypothetical protein